jgi:tetratricopeptide (TPR) repeat protein
MEHTHSHDGCSCAHDHEHAHDHKHDEGILNAFGRRLLSAMIVLALLIFLRPFIIGQLLVRETSYSGNGAYADAIRIGEKIIVLDKHNLQAWTSLGYAYMDQGDTAKAIAAFEKVLELNPQDRGAATYELGQAYYAQGKYVSAIACFERVRGAGPRAAANLEADILKYRHGTLGFRNLNSMQTLLKDLSVAYEKIGDRANASVVNQEYEYYKNHQSKVLF